MVSRKMLSSILGLLELKLFKFQGIPLYVMNSSVEEFGIKGFTFMHNLENNFLG